MAKPPELSSISVAGAFNQANDFAVLESLDADFGSYHFRIGPSSTLFNPDPEAPGAILQMPVTNMTDKPRKVRIHIEGVAPDGEKTLKSQIYDSSEKQTILLELETLEIELVVKGRTSIRVIRGEPKTKKVMVTDAETGAVLALAIVEKPLVCEAMRLEVDESQSSGEKARGISLQVSTYLPKEHLREGELIVTITSPETGKPLMEKKFPSPSTTTPLAVPAGALPWGAYDVLAAFKDAGGRRIVESKATAVILPDEPYHVKVLNNIEKWTAQGKRVVHEAMIPGTYAGMRADQSYDFWAGQPGMVHANLCGLILNEFYAYGGVPENFPVYVAAIERLLAEKPGRLFYLYLSAYGGPDPMLPLVRPLVEYSGVRFANERYFAERPTQEAARSYLESVYAEYLQSFREKVPGSVAKTIAVMSWICAPPETTNINPLVNYKVFLDMQCQVLAADPRCRGLGGVQLYYSRYADEEYVRWAAKLFRHYWIEGRTDLLSTDPYNLDHIRNPDFEQGVEGWTVSAAEPDSVGVKRMDRYGSIQGRYPGVVPGDTFLWMKRSEKKPNLFSQEIRDLEPGRTYSMKMYVADYPDLKSDQKLVVSVTIDGAEMIREKCLQGAFQPCHHPDYGTGKKNYVSFFRLRSCPNPHPIPHFLRPSPPGATFFPSRESNVLSVLVVLSHPLLFPDFKRGNVDFDCFPPGYAGTYRDNWGCLWHTPADETGLEGQVIESPLADWSALDSYQAPDIDTKTERGDRDWMRVEQEMQQAKQRGLPRIGNAERLFDRLYFLRGFENLMIDIATDDQHLPRLIDMLLEYELKLVQKWLDIGVDAIAFHTDIGTQVALMISPRQFRKYIKPMFEEIFGVCRNAGAHVLLSSDGRLLEIVDDLVECGVSMHDPQLRANTLAGIEAAYKGKMCINLDLDRQ